MKKYTSGFAQFLGLVVLVAVAFLAANIIYMAY